MKTVDQIRAEAQELANSADKDYWKDLQKRQVAAAMSGAFDVNIQQGEKK